MSKQYIIKWTEKATYKTGYYTTESQHIVPTDYATAVIQVDRLITEYPEFYFSIEPVETGPGAKEATQE